MKTIFDENPKPYFEFDDEEEFPQTLEGITNPTVESRIIQNIGDDGISNGDKIYRVTLQSALYEIALNSIPSCFTMVAQYGIVFINYIFVGHMNDPTALTGYGLSVFVFGDVLGAFSYGFDCGIDTLVSQAYGNKEYYLCGCILNRSRIMQTILFIPQFLVMFYSQSLLELGGQDSEAAHQTQTYFRVGLPGIFLIIMFDNTVRYMQAMGNFNFPMYITVFTTALHFGISYFFVTYLKWGIYGVGVSTGITFSLSFVILMIGIQVIPGLVPPESWHFFNKDSFIDWWDFIKHAGPAGFYTLLDWSAVQSTLFFAGWIDIYSISASFILFSLLTNLYLASFGISMVINNLIGTSLGAGNYQDAKTYFYSSTLFGVAIAISEVTLLIIFSNNIIDIYTDDGFISDMFVKIVPFSLLYLLGENMSNILLGTINGCGLQDQLMIIFIVSSWFIMVPLSYILAFIFELGIYGIWLSLCIGSGITFISISVVIYRIDWKKLTESVILEIKSQINDI